MTQTNDLPVYLLLYKLLKYLYKIIHNFKREYKYTLGENILEFNWRTIDAAIKANRQPNNKKLPYIRKASTKFDQLKSRLRLAHEIKQISPKQYSHIIKMNEEIGQELTGWLIWARKQTQEKT